MSSIFGELRLVPLDVLCATLLVQLALSVDIKLIFVSYGPGFDNLKISTLAAETVAKLSRNINTNEMEEVFFKF
jgi:hypothetical protein